ncbi:hypothetical protein Fmac_002835 [Flemingia macrophylla]|uniref:Glycosyltransferase n=1 Tax=Flemingia macrophylla TaxID=520843 RepID=A0ABD1NL30_9FABA
MSLEICVVPFWGQGHIFPCVELCNHLTSRDIAITLIIPSTLVDSLPSSLRQHPLLRITHFPSSPTPSPPPPPHDHLVPELQTLFSDNPTRTACAVVDVMMNWSAPVFAELGIPTVAFFTSGACSAAMELAAWKAQPLDLKPGETRLITGLPRDMAITHSDLKQRPHHPPPPPHAGRGPPHHGPPPPKLGGDQHFPPGREPPHHGGGGSEFHHHPPPKFGGPPPWVEEVGGAVAVIFNTCEELEHPFINLIADHIKKPVWGIGPLLPEQYWKSTGSLLHDRDVRSNRESSVTEEQVTHWLDSKPRGSVLYISFGTEVGPTAEEYQELAQALESIEEPFIWALQPGSGRPGPPHMGGESEEGFFPDGLEGRVGNRGIIIRGWAPQLLILSHPSTGGFLSHCGWNSTVEGVGRGVPFLAWPIRGDQYHDAKLVVSHLKVGYMVSGDMSVKVTKGHIVEGIKRLMADKEVKRNAEILRDNFQHGFPTSSIKALDCFKDYIKHRAL